MANLEVVGEVSSARIESAGREDPNPFELGPAKLHIDLEESILRGELDIEEITGGIRVDAETGDVYSSPKPYIDPESSLGRGIAVLEVKAEETVNWMAAKGVTALRRKLDRRHRLRDRRIAELKEETSSSAEFPTMPARTTIKERKAADSTLKWHSRAFKSNKQANLAY